MNLSSAQTATATPLDEYLAQMKSIQDGIIFYGTIVLLFPGFVLNVVNMVVFSRSSFSRNIRFFYMAQSVADTLRVVSSIIQYFPRVLIGTDLNFGVEAICKIINLFNRTFTQAPSWTQVAFSIDRTFNVLFNAKYKMVAGTKYLWSYVVFIGVLVTALCWTSFASTTRVQSATSNQTFILLDCSLPSRFITYHELSGFFSRALVPFVLMITFNGVLIHALYTQKKRAKKLNKKDFHFAFVIIALNNAFLLINTPFAIYQVYNQVPNVGTEDHRARMAVFRIAGIYTSLIYPSYTFFLNLKFNKLFRKELLQLTRLTCLFKYQPNDLESTANIKMSFVNRRKLTNQIRGHSNEPKLSF
jgi:hypothetical protein